MSDALETTHLSKRYRRTWAVQDCTLAIPTGRIVALVGPNGAGKTTFLHLAAGLLAPTGGSITVFGRYPRTDAGLLRSVGFVAQDVPLYRSFTVAETLQFGARMNPAWDGAFARNRIRLLGIPLEQRVGTLSGGQRAQVALILALGKRPDLLLLDEPLASLDPLARQQFLHVLMETAADGAMTVVLSSHLVVDLARVCDHLIVFAHARLQVSGAVATLLQTHRVLTGRHGDAGPIGPINGVASIVRQTATERHTTLVVRTTGAIDDPDWVVADAALEDLVIAYLGSPASIAPTAPQSAAQPTGGRA